MILFLVSIIYLLNKKEPSLGNGQKESFENKDYSKCKIEEIEKGIWRGPNNEILNHEKIDNEIPPFINKKVKDEFLKKNSSLDGKVPLTKASLDGKVPGKVLLIDWEDDHHVHLVNNKLDLPKNTFNLQTQSWESISLSDDYSYRDKEEYFLKIKGIKFVPGQSIKTRVPVKEYKKQVYKDIKDNSKIKQQPPKQQLPKQQLPKQQLPKQQPPKQQLPKQQPPKQQPPKQQLPKQRQGTVEHYQNTSNLYLNPVAYLDEKTEEKAWKQFQAGVDNITKDLVPARKEYMPGVSPVPSDPIFNEKYYVLNW
jgi:hypothetical protein